MNKFIMRYDIKSELTKYLSARMKIYFADAMIHKVYYRASFTPFNDPTYIDKYNDYLERKKGEQINMDLLSTCFIFVHTHYDSYKLKSAHFLRKEI